MRPTPIKGNDSPWGKIQDTREILSGIVQVYTASHGGWWLSDDRLSQMTEQDARAGGSPYSPYGWFEEDCDVAFPVVAFAEELYEARICDLTMLKRAQETVDRLRVTYAGR